MTAAAMALLRPLERLAMQATSVRPTEVRALLASFATFFAVLTAYYIVRPMREELGTMLTDTDKDALKSVFVIVFLVMLAAVPIFGWVVSRFPKRHVVPIVYLFFMTHLAIFWATLGGHPSRFMAMSFFVWVSVFNLFVVSLFWSVMAASWHGEQAKRLYGVIAAGGTIGALTGPLIAQTFVQVIGPNNLLLVALLFLGLALAVAATLPALSADAVDTREQAVTWSSILDGARRTWNHPYLFRIAFWILLANLISTYFYFEQARIVGAAVTERAARVQLFARMDLAVSALTIAAQIFGTAKVIERFGLGLTTASLPIAAMLGFVALAVAPTLAVIIAVVVIERALHFSFSSPGVKVLWTAADADDKYKAQNFVDTVVYRGGDAASGYYFDWLGKTLGLGAGGLATVTLPLAAIWCWLSFDLARRFENHDNRADKH